MRTLPEQNGHAGSIPRRASLPSQQPKRYAEPQNQQSSSRHKAASTYGAHDNSVPYTTQERHTQPPQAKADDYYSGYDIPPMPSSTRRYKQPPQAVTRITEAVPRRGITLTLKGMLLALTIILLAGILISFLYTSYLAPAVQNYNYTQQYGNPPRIFKIRFNTGHGTKANPDNQYVGINNHGEIEVVELPTGTPATGAKPQLYDIAHLTGAEALNTPITNITFEDVNGDGRVDMEVEVNNTIYVLYNNGKTFQTQP